MIALNAVARNSAPIALILLWGSLKITFSGVWSGTNKVFCVLKNVHFDVSRVFKYDMKVMLLVQKLL